MAKPRLVKVRALFYVLQQVMNGREKRVHQNFDTPSRNIIPNQFQSGLIFQFFFDRVVEIFYKQLNGIETDSVSFNIQDVFDYYEPDVPYNIQQILTNRVGNIAALTSYLWSFMEKTGVFATPFNVWFSNYLTVATTIGLKFAQEIDFDDESELNAFPNID